MEVASLAFKYAKPLVHTVHRLWNRRCKIAQSRAGIGSEAHTSSMQQRHNDVSSSCRPSEKAASAL